jgi:hypothetical protein
MKFRLISALLLFYPVVAAYAEEVPFTLWDPNSKMPKASEASQLEGVRFSVIKNFEPLHDGYRFLHGVALEWHGGLLFASFGQNRGPENSGNEESRFCVSSDAGLTWSEPTSFPNTLDGLNATSHGVLLSAYGKLWAFNAAFTGNLGGVHTLGFNFDDRISRWNQLGPMVKEGFWPCQRPVKMINGNWIMAGFRVGVTDGSNRQPPAVAISQCDNLKRWRVITIPAPPDDKQWGESAVWVQEKTVVNIARNGKEPRALISVSNDYGWTWSTARKSNLPMAASKPFAGTLSNGQHFLIGSTTADGGMRRSPLTIAVTRPRDHKLCRVFVIRRSVNPGPGESHPGAAMAYPYAVEHEGKLYVGYSNSGGGLGRTGNERELANNNSAELAVIPIESLEVK